jgi:hypothetical protein
MFKRLLGIGKSENDIGLNVPFSSRSGLNLHQNVGVMDVILP